MELSCTYHLLDYGLQNLCCRNNQTTAAQIGIGQYVDPELEEEEIRFKDLTIRQNAKK